MADLSTILQWFKTGDFPTEAQFRETFSSFINKNEKIPISQVQDLAMALQSMASSNQMANFQSTILEMLGEFARKNAENIDVEMWKEALGIALFATVDNGADQSGTVYKKEQTDNIIGAIQHRLDDFYDIIDTVNELKNHRGLFEGQAIILLGYYSSYDKKPIVYTFSPDMSIQEDGGHKIKTVNGVWVGHFIAEVNVLDFGCLNGNNNTFFLQKAFDFCHKNNLKLIFPDNFETIIDDYLLLSDDTIGDGLHVDFGLNSKITVERASNMGEIISITKNRKFNVEIIARGLVVDLNNRSTGFIRVINNNDELGGCVNILGISVKNAKKGASISSACLVIYVCGYFEKIKFKNILIDGASLEEGAEYGNEVKGIAVTNLIGDVIFTRCEVNNITNSMGIDADGFAVFSEMESGQQTKGKALFVNCKAKDNSGRQIKSQCSNTVIVGCSFERKSVETIQQGVDIDFQAGNGSVENSKFIYNKMPNGQSPLSTNFMIISFQNILINTCQRSKITNIEILTEIEIPIVAYSNIGKKKSDIIIDGIRVFEIDSKEEGSNCINRSVFEFSANKLMDSDGLSIDVRNVSVNTTMPLIGYTGLVVPKDFGNKLFVKAINTYNKIVSSVFKNVSGSIINSYQFVYHNNTFFSTFMPLEFLIDFNSVMPNNDISFSLDNVTLINGPADIPTTGYATLKTLSNSATGWNYREINVNGGEKIYGNLTGVWHTIK